MTDNELELAIRESLVDWMKDKKPDTTVDKDNSWVADAMEFGFESKDGEW